MKRQETGKKSKKWLVSLICVISVLVVSAAAAAVYFLWPSAESAGGYDGKLYWNVERETYKTGQYFHQQVEEDIYRLLFSVDGEQVKLDVKGFDLVNYIDTMDVMGLVFDKDGLVVDALHVEQCTGGYAANQYYVTDVNGNEVTVNNNYAFRGHSKVLEITENTGIYNVGESGPLCGIPGVISFNDVIVAVEDTQGNVTHVFTKPYVAPGDVYWNVKKMYDSVNKISTRQPNEMMLYEIEFIVNGEAKTLYCKNPEVVNKIDSARIMGLEFDENGYIIEMKTVRQIANGGRPAATNYYVSDLNFRDGQIQVRDKAVVGEAKTTSSFFPAENMVVYDMTGNDGPLGIQSEIQVNDRIIFVLDRHSKIKVAFITARVDDIPLYWNVDRDWNKTTKSTNRTPDKDGWYYFTMAANGEHVKVKTNSLEIANAIENPVNIGLRLDGDVVVETIAATKLHPGGVYASYLYVKEIREDGTIVAERTTDGVTSTKVAKVAEDCQFYNVSMTSIVEGEKISLSQIKVGDTVHGYKNFNGEISILYVVGSVSDSPMYWNIDKNTYWDAKNEVSTRKPDSDGYYKIRLAVNGKQVTLRTRDKKIVDDIDGRTCMAFKLSGSNILKVYGAVQTVNTKGGLFASSYHVTAINGKTITATKLSGTDEGKTESRTMAWNCQVYDVSGTAKLVGEKSTVNVGDQIRCLLNEDKQIAVLYVLTAANHAEAHKCDCCGKTPVWLAWDGNTTITKSGHYVLNSDITAAHGIKWDKDLNVTLCLNGHKLTVEDRRVFSNVTGTLNIVDCVGTGHVHGTTNNNASITLVEGGTLNIYGGTFTANEITEVKNGGLFTIIGGGKINMYGGTITGGKTNGYGGNINVSDGTLTVNGGVISNGTSVAGQYGGNIALSSDKAVMIMNGGKISGGNSGSYGGNIAVSKAGAKLQINGGTIENGTASTHGGNITVAMGTMNITGGQIVGGTAPNYGSAISAVNDSAVTITGGSITGGQMRMSNTGGLTLGGKVTIENLHLYNIQLKLSQDKPLKDASVKLSMVTPGVFAEGVATDLSGCFGSVDPVYAVYFENNQLLLDSAVIHRHCDCGGAVEHTCDENIRWQPYVQDMQLVDGGHYFLTADILDNMDIADNATVYLCLNGHTLSSNARVFGNITAGKTLNVYDCGTTGTVHGMTNNNAAVAMVNGGTLNIYGGTYTVNVITEENKNGGILMAMNEGVINLYNGLVTGGNTTGHGGCVYLTNDAQLNMYGGVVSGGTSAKDGGTIAITGNARFTMVGGSVTGGAATGKGYCVFSGSTAPVVLGGSIVIGDVYVDTVAITLSDTVALDTAEETKASIGITKLSSGDVVTGITAEQAACFTNNGEGTLEVSGDKLILNFPHAHCVCTGSETKPKDHVCTEKQVWTGITASTTISDSGYYFLDWSGNKAAAITVSDGVHAHLCLNGATIYAMKTITLGEGSTLDICDCSEEQTGIIGQSGSATRGAVVMDKASTINLFSGTIIGTLNSNQRQCVVMNHADARFNMYGGKITKGVSGSYGGNVAVQKGTFTMYAGLISEGQATTHGGNITASGGSFVMKGGQVADGTATTYGGNVSFVTANSSGRITGGSITGGTAGTYAHCVYVNNNNLLIGGTAVIDELMFGGGNKTAQVSTDEPFATGASIGLALQNAPTNYTTVIKGFYDLSWFTCTMEGFIKDVNGTDIVIKPE